MPKKIPDLENKILQAAKELFETQGYSAVDMKLIASRAGTGVGNLYNYYSSKQVLFLEVSKIWRRDVISRLLGILETTKNPREALKKVLVEIYLNVEAMKGLWDDFMTQKPHALLSHNRDSYRKGFAQDEDRLIKKIQELLTGILSEIPGSAPLLEDPENRFSTLLLTSVFLFPHNFPGKTQANIAFLENLVNFLVPEDPAESHKGDPGGPKEST